MDRIPLAFYVDPQKDEFRLHCDATPEQNNGEPCMWSWPILSEGPGERWYAVENAINHALQRHMGTEYQHTKF